MKIIVVTSTNPVKQQAALQGFQVMFPEETFEVNALSVPSGVSDQPASESETLQGAINRARSAMQQVPTADYWVGIEGGVQRDGADLLALAWVYICSKEQCGRARTGSFVLPPPVAELIAQGKELGEADDIVFNQSNSKQKNGAIGLLTGDVLDRTRFYTPAVILALIPFKNRSLYLKE